MRFDSLNEVLLYNTVSILLSISTIVCLQTARYAPNCRFPKAELYLETTLLETT